MLTNSVHTADILATPPSGYSRHAKPTPIYLNGEIPKYQKLLTKHTFTYFKSGTKSEMNSPAQIVFKKDFRLTQSMSICRPKHVKTLFLMGTGAFNGSCSDAMTLPVS